MAVVGGGIAVFILPLTLQLDRDRHKIFKALMHIPVAYIKSYATKASMKVEKLREELQERASEFVEDAEGQSLAGTGTLQSKSPGTGHSNPFGDNIVKPAQAATTPGNSRRGSTTTYKQSVLYGSNGTHSEV